MSMLEQGWDKGQLGAAIDQIQQELSREEKGTRQGISRFIGGMQKTMQEGATKNQDRAPTGNPTGKILGTYNQQTGEFE